MKRSFYNKSIISMFLAFLIIIPMTISFAVPASAETVQYAVEGGYIKFDPSTGTITGCTSKAESLDIPSSINGVDVTSIGEGAFAWSRIKSITVPKGVTVIGASAFASSYLQSISLPETVTYIGESAFYSSDLQSVTIPEGVTGIAKDTFSYSSLKSIVLPDSLMSIGDNAFAHTYLGSIDIPDNVTSIGDYAFLSSPLKSVTLSSSLTSIGKSAFEFCTGLTSITIPDGVTGIEDNTFYCCSSLESIVIPKSVMRIGTEAFYTCESLDTIYYKGSEADWANISNRGYAKIPGNVNKVYDYPCSLDLHIWGEWTPVSEEVESRTCSNCGKSETQSISKPESEKTVITTENYTVNLTNASIIDHIRYVPGVYTTSADIRNAEGVINVNATAIGNLAVNDVLSFDVKTGGTYSFWIRFTDGSSFIAFPEFTNMTQTVTTDGLMATVHNLYGVKDYFIGKGTYNSYRELKNGENVGRVTSTKIAGEKSFATTLPGNGEYTVCVRYEDTNRPDLMLYFSVEVDMPEIEVNGLQVNMSGLTDVRVIRTAPGEWETPGQVKRAEGARNIKGSALKGSDTFTLQYSDEGVYTLTLEYYNGLTVVKTFEIEQKTPSVEQNGNSVTFGDLDDLYVIRYAKGEYTYAGDIKRAEGAMFIRPSAIDENGNITVELEEGLYTFCVQYNDMSYNYYTIVVE